MKNKSICGLVFALSLGASAVQANDFYTGIQYSKLTSELSNSLGGATANPTAINLVVGKELSENFSVEAFIGKGISDDVPGSADFSVELDNLVGATVLGTYPVSRELDVYGKVGYAQIDYSDTDGDKADGSGIVYGIGAKYKVTQDVCLNVEFSKLPDSKYDNYDIDIDTRALNLGAFITF
ncbi:outer membrane beta-barrel protein [Marinomonas mediterranea]|uniref:porin family protein n=1 Tax=Marinomonas mediterranea TaxID=119864 RepID=UPI00234A489B|nr:porin family protein [Marinomonas mediterranea]WCN14360.1 outer membrane beta-barrel protein [Marinomonas mediterranea]